MPEENKKSTSILAKARNTALGVGGFLGRGVKVLAKGAVYPIRSKNWFKSWGEIRHDIKNGGRFVINIPHKEYNPPIKTTQASKGLGVQITEQKKGIGKVSFLVSRTLTGDIPYLNDEQLNKIKVDLPDVTIFRGENKIVIEVDIKKITNDIKDLPEHKGKSAEEIKNLVLEAICNEVDRNLKGLAKITDGEFKTHKDQKLLYDIAEKLYKEYDNQKQSSEKVVVPNQSSEVLALSASDRSKALEAAETLVDSSRGELSKEIANWQNKVEQDSEKIRSER